MTPRQFQQAVLAWYEQHGRKHLPWQQSINHYRVWVSEIMLQQTQVATVIPYYQRFMQSFPTVQALAAADTDQVMQHWAGLGYYARARNLHKAAQMIVNENQGAFPHTSLGWQGLPGVGRSTAAAILAFVEQQPLAILDGNVKRVLGRYSAEAEWPGEPKVAERLWAHAEKLMPSQQVPQYTQAMMDIGATLCTLKHPSCLSCPIQSGCQALQQGDPQSYPGKRPKRDYPIREAIVLLLTVKNVPTAFQSLGRRASVESTGMDVLVPEDEATRVQHRQALKGEGVLLQKRAPKGIWGGLWCPPIFENMQALQAWLHQQGLAKLELNLQPPRQHVFTHFKLQYTPVEANIPHSIDVKDYQWHAFDQLNQLGLPKPIQTLLHSHCSHAATDDVVLRL